VGGYADGFADGFADRAKARFKRAIVSWNVLGGEGAALGGTEAIIALAVTGLADVGSPPGGAGGFAPSRRGDIARLGLRAVAAATLASLMSAAIAGLLV
jgi:CNT family concentrative nucleoside transporter